MIAKATTVDAVLLLLIDGKPYRVRMLEASAFVKAAYRLEKQNSTQVYEVRQTLSRGTRCECRAYKFGSGKACKHVRALRAVGLMGK